MYLCMYVCMYVYTSIQSVINTYMYIPGGDGTSEDDALAKNLGTVLLPAGMY